MQSPRLSVVIPSYNRKVSLGWTLDALERQTLSSDLWEAVVVSDGSTDGTNEYLRDYAKSARYFLRPIVQENAGPSTARNRAIAQATGDIIVFIDDDVEPSPDFLATHLAHHAGETDAVIIGPLLRDPARRRCEPVWIGWEHAMLEKQYVAFQTGEWPQASAYNFYSGNASVRREHLISVGCFDESFTRQEDVELAIRMQRECGVHFVFDYAARAIHRPVRTWEGWLRVPYAYGRLDVISARRGDMDWDRLRAAYTTRNRITRFVARSVLVWPTLSTLVIWLFKMCAWLAYGLQFDRAAFNALSVAYNVHYLEGAHSEMNCDEANHWSPWKQRIARQ